MNTEMPIWNAIVSTVINIEPSLDRPPSELLRSGQELSIELEEGRRVRLDPRDSRSVGFAQVLAALKEQRRPVYIEVDAEGALSRLLIPHVSRIVDVRSGDEGALVVELELSHALHVVPASAPNHEQLASQLAEAFANKQTVILTETDAHQIIDVRDYSPAEVEADRPFVRPTSGFRRRPLILEFFVRFWWWRYWPWWCWWSWFHSVSWAQAQQAFNAMNATTCAPLTVPPPCIPFLYPDDGCWGRAHEMCRLMINMGLGPRKVWIQGSLHVSTRNNPTCAVGWAWHVAPTLKVRRFPRCTETMVIDPSLFTTPVSEATWKSVQGDPNATLTASDASDFLWGATDPTYVQTNQVLAFYRLQLQNRSIQQGPPPYANCP